MIIEENKRKFKSALEAEQYIEETYKGKVVQFHYWHKRKEALVEKTGMVDRVAIDVTQRPVQVLLFFTDGTKNEFDKDDFFNEVKIL